VRTVRSLLASDDAHELLVIDQSDGDEARDALADLCADARLRYVRSRATGKGAALNEGLRYATGDIVVCTDDDCEAPPRWASEMAQVMDAHPQAAVVFCNVFPDTHDPAAGYVPAYQRTSDRALMSIRDARSGMGLGAGMAVRREVILGFGGFDETFGPGSRFLSGDDRDISLRALIKGWQVYDTAATSVRHFGFRTHAEGKEHALRDWIAIGALCAKPIRAGHLGVLGLAGWWFCADALWPPLRDVLALKRPSGMSRILGFVQGFTAGLRVPVDRQTLAFRQ
jgi:GT2 family glycosyltransferase